MRAGVASLIGFCAALLAFPLQAASAEFASSRKDSLGEQAVGDREDDPPYLQCVPYARDVSGIRIFGDAHTWWDQAADRYARGTRPMVGAVMSFRPFGSMRLGHVAAVSRIVDKRTVLLRHSNWSPIGGRRGQIENDVRAVDVSAAGDWSEVRVWFAPIQALGTTHWPLNGFIYPDKATPGAGKDEPLARTTLAMAGTRQPPRASRIGADFLKGIAPEIPVRPGQAVKPGKAVKSAQRKPENRPVVRPAAASDPIGALIASRS